MALTMTVEILDSESSNYPAKGVLALQRERDVMPSKRERLQKAGAKKFNYIFVSICSSVKWRYYTLPCQKQMDENDKWR